MFLFCLIAGSEAAAQIIDDTTKVLYSPKTTLRLYENDVLEGRYLEQSIDTTIQNMHNERFWYHDTAYFQHLGNVGTAAKPILFRLPTKIGARSGRNAFNRYAYNPETINYYDTRSPYSHIYYIQGQRGEQVFEGTHARNITPRWNAGVAYQILTANRQIGVSTLRREGYVSNQAVKAFTHYRSKNDKYDLFANYTHLNHEQIEFGGILPGPLDSTQNDLFKYQAELTNLNQAASREFRSNYHLLHIYKLAKEDMKLYHSFDWGRQRNIYQDDEIPYRGDSVFFYPDIKYDSAQTDDRTVYREMENVFGITGNNKLSFYKAYVKNRSSKMEYTVLDTINNSSATERFNQLFVGGQLRLVYGKALVSVDGEFQMTRDYKVSATAKLGPLQGRIARVLRSPSMIEQRLISNHFNWHNNFNNSVTDRIEGTFTSKLGERQHVRLTGHYNNIKRHVFFNKQAIPEQATESQQIFGAELKHHIRFGSIHFENFVAYTNTDEAPDIRIPEWLVDSKLYFQGFLFKKALLGQFGVQMYLPSEYLADAYMPVTQQFYLQPATEQLPLQNQFLIRTYPVIDVFLTADIKNLNVFLKMSHINEGLTDPGYFVTPYYPGMQTSFIFGIKWMFFD
ncbi:hypothetical protein OB13_13885 [Pontibacter sp. HJ8]